MFKTLGQKLQSLVVALLVGLLVAVFVLQFGGPQARGCSAGGGSYAAKVYGHVITQGDFEAAYALGNFERTPLDVQKSMHLKEHVLQGLVERTLLATQARELGFEVGEQEVMNRLAQEGTAYLSLGVNAPSRLPSGEIPVPVKDRDGNFDKQAAKRFIQYHLQRSVSEFTRAQIEEALAEKMRKVVRETVSVSPREVWDTWAREQNKARLLYVKFSPEYFRPRVEVTDEAVREWRKAHTKQVDKEYKANKHRYTDLEKQVRARHILIETGSDASDKEQEKAREEAKRLLEQLRGGADFAKLARKHSDDKDTATEGGMLGWRTKGDTKEKAFEKALFSLKPGELSDVVETSYGYHLVKVTDVREGDVPVEEAKREIATRLYREARAEALARNAAKATLTKMREGAERKKLESWVASQRPVWRKGSKAAGASGKDIAKAKKQASGNKKKKDGSGESDGEDLPSNAPKVRDSGRFTRTGTPITGAFDPAQIVQAAFDMDQGDVLDEPMRAGSDFLAFRVSGRSHPKREDFTDDERTRVRDELRSIKRDAALRRYIDRLRERAETEGAVLVNKDVLVYGEQAGPPGRGRKRAPPPTGL